MHGYLVLFRCHGHDALELEHLYHCPDGTHHHHPGYEALCAACSTVAMAARYRCTQLGRQMFMA